MDVFYQELPLDVIFSGSPLLHTLIITNCIIQYNDDNNTNSYCNSENDRQQTFRDNHPDITMTATPSSQLPLGVVPLSKLILRNAVIRDPKSLTRIAERCPQLSHVDLSSCFWLKNPSCISTIRGDMSAYYFSYFRISQPGICFNIVTDAYRYLVLHGIASPIHEDQQPLCNIKEADGSDAYFMMIVKETDEKGGEKLSERASAALFEVNRAQDRARSMNIKRCQNKDVSAEVEQQIILKALSDRRYELKSILAGVQFFISVVWTNFILMIFGWISLMKILSTDKR